ncbi:hemolysin family protein [Apibacter sp. HY039]|uniref:hemolysin family protein n=1 Tax=Apibacter sp. HY039 TaxID=2501476 RepID=UPI000FEB8E2D|nr:hemolysin family protein [Apibacter sp. HY039]
MTIIIISTFCVFFFSGMKEAFLNSNRMLLELERKKNSWLSKLNVYLGDHPKRYLATLTAGYIISIVFLGYFSILHLGVGSFLINNSEYISLLLTLFLIFSFLLILIFVSRVIFTAYSDTLLKILSPPAFLFYIILSPLTLLLSRFLTFFLMTTEEKNSDTETPLVIKEELSCFIDEKIENSSDKAHIDAEVHFFKNALKFSDLQARDCMIHRKEIIAVNVEEEIETLTQAFNESGFSKILIFRNVIDNVIGYVHIFDLFKMPKSIKHILLPIEIVHETSSVQEIMNRMLKKSRTIAVVLDEYGGTSGLITLEDIVEELFGNIEDEHDKSDCTDNQIDSHHFCFSAKLSIEYLNQKYNLNLPESNEYSSLGGFLISLTRNIPLQGSEIQFENKTFSITQVSNSKIEEVSLSLNAN